MLYRRMISDDGLSEDLNGRLSLYDVRMNTIRPRHSRRALSFDTDPIKEEPDEGEIPNYDYHVVRVKKSFSNSSNSISDFKPHASKFQNHVSGSNSEFN